MNIMHCCVSVRGLLRQSDRELTRMCKSITIDGKHPSGARQLRDFLMDKLADGWEVLPTCDCDNFDMKKGCLGHKSEQEENT